MTIPKEIYELIDYIETMKHPEKTKELFIAFAEGSIEQGDDSLEGSELLGGEGFAFTDITRGD